MTRLLHSPVPVSLALSTFLLGACASGTQDPTDAGPPPTDDGSTPAVVTTADTDDEDGRPAAAIALVRSGDFRGARELLGELLREEELASARKWLGEDSPADALVAIDRALALDRDDPTAVFLKARASFGLGEKAIRDGGPGSLVNGAFQDALAYYERGGDDVNALLGASRSAVKLQRYDEGLALARRAIARLDELDVEPEVVDDPERLIAPGLPREADLPLLVEVTPERVLAEASYLAFVDAQRNDPEGESARTLFSETEAAFDRLLGRDRGSWTWSTLVDLYLWRGDASMARSQAENGLDHDPNDLALIDRLARAAHQVGGPGEMAATFQRFNARHADNARGLWYEAQGHFDRATDAVIPRVAEAITGSETEADATEGEATEEASTDPVAIDADYARAEEIYRRCREVDPAYANACLAYEALCRNGRGWDQFAAGELEQATATFLSMEELYEGGLFAELEGRLLSGIQGIAQVGGAYNARGDWRAAGDAFATIATVDESRSTWANNQGFFYRDAGVELELLGRQLCAAADEGRLDEELLEALAQRTDVDLRGVEVGNPTELMRRAANAAMDEARAVMRKSMAGYEVAMRLSPDDVRIVNDTALILVYYLQERFDEAEAILNRSLELGEAQLALADAEGWDADQRFEIANAYGDAFENLGVLYAKHLEVPEQAIAYFERAVEIGPEERLILTNFWLPYLKGELDPAEVPPQLVEKVWAAPCTD